MNLSPSNPNAMRDAWILVGILASGALSASAPAALAALSGNETRGSLVASAPISASSISAAVDMTVSGPLSASAPRAMASIVSASAPKAIGSISAVAPVATLKTGFTRVLVLVGPVCPVAGSSVAATAGPRVTFAERIARRRRRGYS